MEIEFDAAKDELNRAKHGISLSEAVGLGWDSLEVKPDLRRDYGEARQIGYALMATRLYCVVFVEREGVMRIISLRRANDREVEQYESQR
jgi:uncharacterized DUF497 family protein